MNTAADPLALVRTAPPKSRTGAGLSQNATTNLAIATIGLQSAAATGVVVGAATLAISGSSRASGIAAVVGALLGAAFGSWVGYEAKQAASQ